MATLANDTFTRANQSGWGTASDGINTWGSPTNANASASISSNQGLFGNMSTSGDSQIVCGSHASTTSINMLAKVSTTATTNLVGLLWRWTSASSNGYRCGFFNGTEVNVDKYAGGSRSSITSFSFTWSANTNYWIRLIHTAGNVLMIRVWADGSSEPGTWNVNQSETTYSSGNFGCSIFGSGSSNHGIYSSFTVTDNSTATHALICDGFGGVFS